MAAKVFPAVVHIEVASYAPLSDDDDEPAKSQVVTKQHGSGSGIIVDADGYLVTAYHVVEGARRIRVELDKSIRATLDTATDNRKRKAMFDARIVGAFKDADLAVRSPAEDVWRKSDRKIRVIGPRNNEYGATPTHVATISA